MENGLLNEYPVHVTNHVPTTVSGGPAGTSYSPIIFGNFSTTKILQWGDVYMDMVNANAGSGYYQLVVNTFWDNVFTHAESFAAIGDVNLGTVGFGS